MSNNIIILGFKEEEVTVESKPSRHAFGDIEPVEAVEIVDPLKVEIKRNYNYENRHNCYCKKCKIQFLNVTEEYCYPANRRIIITCPSCGEVANFGDLKTVDRMYCLYREWHVNGDKITINFKNMSYCFIKGKLFPKFYHNMVVLNLKTGYSYSFPTTINGKKLRKEDRMYNCTYLNKIGWQTHDYMADNYSDKCKSMTQLCEELYNYIKEYKINNKLVNSYILTFDQAFNLDLYRDLNNQNSGRLFYHYDNDFSENKKRNILENYSFHIGYITLFNRFPTISPLVSKKLFYPVYNQFSKKVVKTRRKIKQDNKDIIKFILEQNNIPTSSKNKKSLLKTGFEYTDKFIVLNKVFSLDNIYKIIDYIDKITAETIEEVINLYQLDTKQKNNLCNKIERHIVKYCNGRFNDYFVYDTFHTLKHIKGYIEDYKPNWKLSIKELHDVVNSDYRKAQSINKEIDYSGIIEKYPNLLSGEYDGLKFALAKDTYELIDVGSYMSICVGSYDSRAINHYCYIVIVRDINNKPFICIELDKDCKTLKQVKLKYNNTPDDITTDTIFKWCEDNDLNLKTCYDIPQHKILEYYNIKEDDKIESNEICQPRRELPYYEEAF